MHAPLLQPIYKSAGAYASYIRRHQGTRRWSDIGGAIWPRVDVVGARHCAFSFLTKRPFSIAGSHDHGCDAYRESSRLPFEASPARIRSNEVDLADQLA